MLRPAEPDDAARLALVAPGPAQVWVAEENPRARRFYTRNGFEPDGTRHADARFGGIVEIRVVR